jgi:CRP-like cAMP-binding protein
VSILGSLRPRPETRDAYGEHGPALAARHRPGRNCVLAALPVSDYERLLPALEPVPLPLGFAMHSPGELEGHLYFLTDGVVSRYELTARGESAEYALAGREGVIGIASFLGGESMPNRAVVLCAGYAYRLAAGLVLDELRHGYPLAQLLLRYTQALITQVGQIAVCNRHHSLEQQLCRWILSYLDRAPSHDLAVTQGLMATLLGVRREGVTEAASRLRRAGLIRYRRGHIDVLDRRGLETRACECYSVIKREYERLLAPGGPASPAGANTGRRPAHDASPCFGF